MFSFVQSRIELTWCCARPLNKDAQDPRGPKKRSGVCRIATEKVRATAREEPAWQLAGKQAGVQVWRLEQLQVVPWPNFGDGRIELCAGDSYIILESGQGWTEMEYHIYFWLGSGTSMDEQIATAYKTVELDACLDGGASQTREVEGHESEEFRELFPTITYLEGGMRSALTTSINKTVQVKLLHIRQTAEEGVVKKEVALSRDSLNHGDTFVLDAGKRVYVWFGDACQAKEKFAAFEVAKRLESGRHGQCTCTHDLDDEFWQLLGGQGPIRSAGEVSDCIKDAELGDGILYALTNEGGGLRLEEVGRGELHPSMLDSEAVMMLDHGYEISVWIGNGADEQERRNAYRSAMIFLKSNERDVGAPIRLYKESKGIRTSAWSKIFGRR